MSKWNGIPDTDPDDWWQDWEVNVKGVYLVTRAFWPLLLKSSLKIIINVTSIGALTNTPHGSAYGPAKLASLRFTEYIAQDHGERADGIISIAVHPGSLKTDLSLCLPEHLHGLLVDSPEISGDTLTWLGSERRQWLSGRYVSANWDMEELSKKREEIVKADLLKVRMAVNTFPSQ